ncbi:MAG TPA: hypothetical protein DCP47_06925 [Phycisphaerales bacterium]|nr:hypothetical protein [Phycisphaerales bacterium]
MDDFIYFILSSSAGENLWLKYLSQILSFIAGFAGGFVFKLHLSSRTNKNNTTTIQTGIVANQVAGRDIKNSQ